MKTKNKTALLSFLLVSISSVLVPSRAAASCSCQTSTGLFGIGLFGIGVETIPPECVAACDVQKAEGSNVAAYQDQSQINSTQQAITMDHKNVTAACASPTSAACTAATNALVNDLQKLAGQTQTLTQDAGAAVQDIKAAQTAETQTAKTDDQKAAADRAAAVKAKDAALQVQGLESNTAPGSPLFADDQKQIQQDQAAEAKDNAQAAKDSAAAAAAQHGDAYLSRPTSYLVQQQTTAQAELQKTYAAQKTAYQNNLANAQADQAAANKNIKKYQASLSLMTPNSQQYNDVANLIREQQNAAAKANKDINTWNGMLGSVGAPPPPPPPAQSGGFNPCKRPRWSSSDRPRLSLSRGPGPPSTAREISRERRRILSSRRRSTPWLTLPPARREVFSERPGRGLPERPGRSSTERKVLSDRPGNLSPPNSLLRRAARPSPRRAV